MKTSLHKRPSNEEGSLVAYFVFVLIFLSTLATLSAYVTQTSRLAQRRADMVSSLEYAQGGAVVAAYELERAFTNRSGGFFDNLTKNPGGAYTLKTSTTTDKVYERVISSPFSNQTVTVQLWMTNAPFPPTCKIVAVANVGKASQTAVLNTRMTFALGAAIISDSPGTTSTSISKSIAQDGNVVVDADKLGPTVIDGGSELAILANGRVNIDPVYASVPANSVSMTNYNSANPVPDYTASGSPDQLFDFNRFIAVANMAGTHYTNLNQFFLSNNVASAVPGGALEGIIVVDVAQNDPKWNSMNDTTLPKGINVRGTLVLNFGAGVVSGDKIINTADLNINAANLAGMNPLNPKTYPTGYPPVYTDPSKQPWKYDITSKGFANFTPLDDLPALMYNVGTLDMHANANICGCLYTPDFVEIENKAAGQIQYIKGSIIGGGGVYVENKSASKTVISFDQKAVDFLATSGSKGKKVVAAYWK